MLVKPNFIGIGGQKCASTWFSECLRSHPEIFMSSPKELRYFSDNMAKGLDWYLYHFRSSAQCKLRGEFSSNYIYWPESARRIKNEFGDVKILAVVRDPVDRSLSHVKHLIRDGVLPRMSGEISRYQLEKIIFDNPEVLSNSMYQPGLKAYVDVFGANSVLVVDQQDCLERGEDVMASVWSFLEVKSDFFIPEVDKLISEGVNPRYHILESFRIGAFSYFKYRAPWLINWIKKSGLSQTYRKLNKGAELSFSSEALELLKFELCYYNL